MLRLAEGAHLHLEGQMLIVDDATSDITIEGEGNGATIDAQGRSRHLVIQSGRVTLRRLRLVDGMEAEGIGGCVLMGQVQGNMQVPPSSVSLVLDTVHVKR